MDTTAELLEAIDSAGWTVTSTAHEGPYPCHGCLYAALNGPSLARVHAPLTTGYTSGGHEATIIRKDT
jgi:hypothetical protein